MKFIYASLLVIVIFQQSFGQKSAQKGELFAYNVLFSGVTSGIGAIINSDKKSNKKKLFIKGFWQGCLGGVFNFSSKEMIYLIQKNDNLTYSWLAKLLHSSGTSITENAALNNPFLKHWHMNVGAMRVDFSTDNSNPFKIRLLPQAIFACFWASRFGKFNISKTLSTGSIIFQNHSQVLTFMGNRSATGYNLGRSILIGKDWIGTSKVIAHEIIHEFQFDEYQMFNTWLSGSVSKLVGQKISNITSKYIYADIPYFWLPYHILKRSGDNYYKNFFEFEAESSATNRYIVR